MKPACAIHGALLKIILGTWAIVKFNLPNAFIFQIANIFSSQIICLYGRLYILMIYTTIDIGVYIVCMLYLMNFVMIKCAMK